jgi:hypothetical protein
MYTGENLPMTMKESQNTNYDAALEIITVFKETSRNFIIIFLFH